MERLDLTKKGTCRAVMAVMDVDRRATGRVGWWMGRAVLIQSDLAQSGLGDGSSAARARARARVCGGGATPLLAFGELQSRGQCQRVGWWVVAPERSP
jgi:hypothetical protein